MILRPAQLAKMRLGVSPSWVPPAPQPKAAVAMPGPPLAYGRDVLCPRVTGFNDVVGDCVPTGCCNAVQTFFARQGKYKPIPDTLPLEIYSAVTGYVKGDAATDQGTDIDAMIAWWKQNPIAGVKLRSAVPFDPRFPVLRQSIISNVGYIGAVCALATQQQNEVDWQAIGTPGSWGYHFICMDQYDGPTGSTSWGQEKWIDEDFFNNGFVVALYDFDLYYAS